MAFALVCGAGCGQPDGHLIDGGFDQLTWAALGIDGELRADDLDQVGAGERGLLDLFGRIGDERPVERRARGPAPHQRLRGPAAGPARRRATAPAEWPRPALRAWRGGWLSARSPTAPPTTVRRRR